MEEDHPDLIERKPPAQWCYFADKTQEGVEKILDFASANYNRHTEWFLKHRDRALTELGALIAAELSVAKFMGSPPVSDSTGVLIVIYTVLVLLAVIFGLAGFVGCRQAYRAGMESIAVANKAICLLGFTSTVAIASNTSTSRLKPVLPEDTVFVPERWAELGQAGSMGDFLEGVMGSGLGMLIPRRNTCYLATSSIMVMALGGVVIGVTLILKAKGIL
jgi:hypothetical protein